MNARYQQISPLLTPQDAEGMLRIAESFGHFGTYAAEASSVGLGERLPQRFDAAFNYVTGGMDGRGNPDSLEVAAQRTNYFRETYAYGDDIQAPGIEPFMNNPAMKHAARQVSGSDFIVPAIVYANILLPGQELAMHTDVPEFRGANRKVLPQWLLVVMLHSGLFDDWRIRIVTCVSWFGNATGGAFIFYPEGVAGCRESLPATHNSAIVIDTDEVFHGVERVGGATVMPGIDKETRLHFAGGDRWHLRKGDRMLAEYTWSDLRYSISWKAYCFASAEDENAWREHIDDLSADFILGRLEAELRQRGVLDGPRPEPTSFALMLVQAFLRFPTATGPA